MTTYTEPEGARIRSYIGIRSYTDTLTQVIFETFHKNMGLKKEKKYEKKEEYVPLGICSLKIG